MKSTEPEPRSRRYLRAVSTVGTRRGGVPGAIGFTVGYLALSYLLLRPVLSTFVIADDFEGPFAEIVKAGPGLGSAINVGLHAEDRTRVLGVAIAEAFNWAWLWLSSTFDVSIEHIYSLVKFGALVGAAASVATFWWVSARGFERPVRWRTALLLTSVTLFGTLQLHGLWSNDPVQSYPMAGYVSTAIGFLVLAATVWAAQKPSWRRFAAATVLGLASVSYYEFNAAAVLGGAVILAASALRYRRGRQRLGRYALGAAAFCLVPLLWLAITRASSGGDAYSGRQLQSTGALHTFVYGLLGNLPGAAWSLSASVLGAGAHIGTQAMVIALVAIVLVVVWLWLDPQRRSVAPDGTVGRALLTAVPSAAATGIYALGALAVVSATQRVEGSTPRIGYVYTPYAVGSSAVALAIAVLIWFLATRRGQAWLWVRVAAVAGIVVFVSLQTTYNMRLRDLVNSQMGQNHAFDMAFAAGVPETLRCNAMLTWASFPWPDYYRSDVVHGAYDAYREYYGAPFCGNWTDPTDGFSEPFPQNGGLAWWLTQDDGALQIESTGCARGCSGRLRFTAAAFAKPHTFALSLNGVVIARFGVSTTARQHSIPLRLTGTFASLGVRASGDGISPASLHQSADPRKLFLEIAAPQFVRAS